jgi:hypothetical protein
LPQQVEQTHRVFTATDGDHHAVLGFEQFELCARPGDLPEQLSFELRDSG